MISLATFQLNDIEYKIDLSKPLDISIPLKSGSENPSAWYIDAPKIEPVDIGRLGWKCKKWRIYKL